MQVNNSAMSNPLPMGGDDPGRLKVGRTERQLPQEFINRLDEALGANGQIDAQDIANLRETVANAQFDPTNAEVAELWTEAQRFVNDTLPTAARDGGMTVDFTPDNGPDDAVQVTFEDIPAAPNIPGRGVSEAAAEQADVALGTQDLTAVRTTASVDEELNGEASLLGTLGNRTTNGGGLLAALGVTVSSAEVETAPGTPPVGGTPGDPAEPAALERETNVRVNLGVEMARNGAARQALNDAGNLLGRSGGN